MLLYSIFQIVAKNLRNFQIHRNPGHATRKQTNAVCPVATTYGSDARDTNPPRKSPCSNIMTADNISEHSRAPDQHVSLPTPCCELVVLGLLGEARQNEHTWLRLISCHSVHDQQTVPLSKKSPSLGLRVFSPGPSRALLRAPPSTYNSRVSSGCTEQSENDEKVWETTHRKK